MRSHLDAIFFNIGVELIRLIWYSRTEAANRGSEAVCRLRDDIFCGLSQQRVTRGLLLVMENAEPEVACLSSNTLRRPVRIGQ